MRSTMRKEWLFIALIVAAGFFGAPSPRDAGAAGKPDTLNVVVIGDFSGPYAPVVGPTRPGAEDAWQYINSKMGGVHGVKVTPVIRDMGGKIDVGQSMYNEAITIKPKPLFVDVYISPLSASLRQRRRAGWSMSTCGRPANGVSMRWNRYRVSISGRSKLLPL